MTLSLPTLDWSLVQTFLAVAEHGSLSGAARALGQSQPTLGRHVKQIEEQLGLEVFIRHSKGLSLNEVGKLLLAPAQRMHEAQRQFALTAAGQDHGLAGTVRLTASEFVSHHVLPGIIAQIRIAEPAIAIELVPSDSTENLLFREADIAVRMYRSKQLDIVTQHIGDVRLGLFASHDYLARAGRPTNAQELMDHDIVGYDKSELILRGMRELGLPATRDWFSVRCDNQTVYWELVKAGCGIGFGQIDLFRNEPCVELLELGIDIPGLPVWLAAPQAMHATPRIKKVWHHLQTGLRPFVS